MNLLVFPALMSLLLCFAGQSTLKVDTTYDTKHDLTTVRLGPVHLSGAKGRYHSLEFALEHQYPGQTATKPQAITFDLVSVVKGRRLNTDLYVVFVIDGEPTHFGSNRTVVRNPVPGRLWIGERMIFSIPVADFQRMATAKTLSLKMGGVTFAFKDEAREALRKFASSLNGP